MRNTRVTKYFIVLAFFLFVIQACKSKRFVDREEYLATFNEAKEELHKTRITDRLTFEAFYLSSEYLALREIGAETKQFSNESFKSALQKYDSAIYIGFKISPTAGAFDRVVGTKENKARLMQYLLCGISEDFALEIGDKKYNCTALECEPDFNVQNSISFIMCFEKSISGPFPANLVLAYEDRTFQNGILKFNFREKVLNDLPKIKAI